MPYTFELATRRNFDDLRYMLANPDVAAAVNAGSMPSALEHFIRHGEKEGRKQVRDMIPPFGFYENRAPSPQNALDLFADNWVSELPGYGYGYTKHIFDDSRLKWFIDNYGTMQGKKAIELGPLEGAHTYMLSRAGAEVTAIEGNAGAFLRCLIVKEVYKINANFLFGDFVTFIHDTDQTYDIAVASGVLYHMTKPVQVLADLMRISPSIFVWTHYFDENVITREKIKERFDEVSIFKDFRGHTVELRQQHYRESLASHVFCGGPEHTSYWITKKSLMAVFEAGGYDVTVFRDDLTHPNGPAITLSAIRRA